MPTYFALATLPVIVTHYVNRGGGTGGGKGGKRPPRKIFRGGIAPSNS